MGHRIAPISVRKCEAAPLGGIGRQYSSPFLDVAIPTALYANATVGLIYLTAFSTSFDDQPPARRPPNRNAPAARRDGQLVRLFRQRASIVATDLPQALRLKSIHAL